MKKNAVIFSVVSGKGGVGKTVVSSNFAYLAAKELGLKTLLLDANLSSSHIFSILKLPTFFNLNQLLQGAQIAPEKILKYNNILDVIPSKIFMSSRDYSRILNLRKVVEKLRGYYDVIIIDAAPGIGRETLAAIDAADTCLIISTPFLPAVADILRVKSVLRELKEKRAKLIMNMVEGKNYEVNEKEVEYITGLPIIARLPFDEKVIDSVASGYLISRFHPYSKFVRALRKATFEILSEEFYLQPPTFFQKISSLFRGLLA